ncbi:MAG: EscN/YscN/HrcN family type III secretion system ATPase, partial [Pirellulaceae bacterium]
MSIEGRVRAIRGTTIVAGGMPGPIGSLVQIVRRQGDRLDAEVIGFDGSATLLAPLGPLEGVSQGDCVRLFRTIRTVPASEDLIGRVLDATGTPIDDLGPIPPSVRVP